tara:strand:- start:789 stop:1490 length:702 start_codon:yes stop_codon:yes gene_type:complete
MAKYSKPMGSRGESPDTSQPDPDRRARTKKSKFFNARTGYRHTGQRQMIHLNGRIFNGDMTPSVTRIELAISYFKVKKYIACSDDKERHMTSALVDDRGRKMLNVLGCSVENSYPARYYYKEDNGEKYARKGIEHIENANIVDPEFATLSPELTSIEESFPNKNDPIYQLDDGLTQQMKYELAKYRQAKNTCATIAAHLVSLNLGSKTGTKLKCFYDEEQVSDKNIYRTERKR